MSSKTYPITPVPEPRQSQRDRWLTGNKKRPCVARYHAFRDLVALYKVELPEDGARVKFFLPMPLLWSKKKKEAMIWSLHKQKPDLKNLLAALEDAVYRKLHKDDCVISSYGFLGKFWGPEGKIVIEY